MLLVTSTAVYFGLASWTDFWTATGTLLGLLPLGIAVVYRRSMNTIIWYLFLSGWILPIVVPPAGVVFGKTEFGHGDDYYIANIYLGGAGFFSRSVIAEHTWEGTHGHTWPIGIWVPGYLVGIGPLVIGGMVLCRMHRASAIVACLVSIGYGLLVVFAFRSFMSDEWWFNWVAGFFCTAYSIFAAGFAWRLLWRGERDRFRRLTALVVLSYPWWVLALSISFGSFPFVGWLSTFAAGVLLLMGRERWFREEAMEAQPLLARLRMLFVG